MNIFRVSDDPTECARVLDDQRLVKMVLETTQLLSSAMYFKGEVGPYRLTHVHHPCTIWVAASRANYRWTILLLHALHVEYTRRFERVHKSSGVYGQLLDFWKAHKWKSIELTEQPNCTEFKQLPLHIAYQQHLLHKWAWQDKPPRWARIPWGLDSINM